MTFIERGRTKAKKHLKIKNHFIRELLAEFFGTGFYVLMGEAAYAAQVLSGDKHGNPVSSNLSWGLGIFFATMATFKISGALFNPALTITWAFLGKVPWYKVVPFILCQTFGAFCGSGAVFCLYFDAINQFDGGIRQVDGPNATAHIFATYPKPHLGDLLGTGAAVFDQVVGTFTMTIGSLAATDPNTGFPEFLVPLAIAFNVAVNGFAFMYNAGGAINPARDLGPRIMTAISGYGVKVFSFRNYNWFWVPIVGPIVGSLFAAVVYNLVLAIHYEEDKKQQESEEESQKKDSPPPQASKGATVTEYPKANPEEELISLISPGHHK